MRLASRSSSSSFASIAIRGVTALIMLCPTSNRLQRTAQRQSTCVRVCVLVCLRARVRAYVRACVRACVCVLAATPQAQEVSDRVGQLFDPIR